VEHWILFVYTEVLCLVGNVQLRTPGLRSLLCEKLLIVYIWKVASVFLFENILRDELSKGSFANLVGREKFDFLSSFLTEHFLNSIGKKFGKRGDINNIHFSQHH